MFDPKISAVAAAVAFGLSFLVGLLSGAGIGYALLRALSFALAFFVLASIAYWLVTQFIPELLGDSETDAEDLAGEESPVGRRVDLSVGDDQEQLYGSPSSGDAVLEAEADAGGDASDAVAGEGASADDDESSEYFRRSTAALDQNSEGGYTGNVGVSDYAAPSRGAVPALPSGLLDEVDVLPDLESMSDSFISPIMGEEEHRESSSPSSPRTQGGQVSLGSGGTFDSRELASAIQTILKRDQKG